MLRYLLLLAVLLKLAKVWKAHIKRSQRHLVSEGGPGKSEVPREDALSDCCCVA